MKPGAPNSPRQPKPFNLVEAHKHELTRKSPENGEKEEGGFDDKSLSEIQKLLYGKANLADIIVQTQKIYTFLPKFHKMRTDIDGLSRQMDLLKYRCNSFVTKEVVDINIHDIDEKLTLLIDSSCKLAQKESSIDVDRRLKKIDDIPQLNKFTQLL